MGRPVGRHIVPSRSPPEHHELVWDIGTPFPNTRIFDPNLITIVGIFCKYDGLGLAPKATMSAPMSPLTFPPPSRKTLSSSSPSSSSLVPSDTQRLMPPQVMTVLGTLTEVDDDELTNISSDFPSNVT